MYGALIHQTGPAYFNRITRPAVTQSTPSETQPPTQQPIMTSQGGHVPPSATNNALVLTVPPQGRASSGVPQGVPQGLP
jgi:hypothetical protein